MTDTEQLLKSYRFFVDSLCLPGKSDLLDKLADIDAMRVYNRQIIDHVILRFEQQLKRKVPPYSRTVLEIRARAVEEGIRYGQRFLAGVSVRQP